MPGKLAGEASQSKLYRPMASILCVSHVAPWPASGGNGLRLQRLLLWLRSQGHQVLLVLTQPPYEAEQTEIIQRHVQQLEIASPRHAMLMIESRKQKIKHLLTRGWPPARRTITKQDGAMQRLADQLCPEHVNQLVKRIAQQRHIDFFIASYPFTIQAFANLPRHIPLLCDTVEIFSMPRWDTEGQAIQPVLHFDAEEERCMLNNCDVALGIQRVESSYLQTLIPERKIITVGVDSDIPSHPGLPSEAGENIGIIGSDNQANQEGIQRFLLHSWPLIQQRRPGAEVHIAGSLGMALRQIWPGELPARVHVLGWLAELPSFYRQLRLVVNPVYRGTGLKIKTVEAIAHHRPVVAYGVGLEGMPSEPEGAWLQVEDPLALAQACAALLEDPARCDAMARKAKEFAHHHLQAERVYHPLQQILEGRVRQARHLK